MAIINGTAGIDELNGTRRADVIRGFGSGGDIRRSIGRGCVVQGRVGR